MPKHVAMVRVSVPQTCFRRRGVYGWDETLASAGSRIVKLEAQRKRSDIPGNFANLRILAVRINGPMA